MLRLTVRRKNCLGFVTKKKRDNICESKKVEMALNSSMNWKYGAEWKLVAPVVSAFLEHWPLLLYNC